MQTSGFVVQLLDVHPKQSQLPRRFLRSRKHPQPFSDPRPPRSGRVDFAKTSLSLRDDRAVHYCLFFAGRVTLADSIVARSMARPLLGTTHAPLPGKSSRFLRAILWRCLAGARASCDSGIPYGDRGNPAKNTRKSGRQRISPSESL